MASAPRSFAGGAASLRTPPCGSPPDFWMNLQKNHELRTAEIERGEEIRRAVHRHGTVAQVRP